MPPATFAIQTTIPHPKAAGLADNTVWFPFEPDGIQTVDEFHAALLRDGLVIGWRYRRVRSQRPGGQEWSRSREILGRGVVGQIATYTFKE